jgi:hypothetical protein
VTPPAGPLTQKYSLVNDSTGALATYEHMLSWLDTRKLNLGVRAFGSDLGVHAKVERKTSITLTYELRGGFDYELHSLQEGEGRVWGAITGSTPNG